MDATKDSVVVVGAGIGGLAAAVRLAAAGLPVTLCEAAPGVGGKMRTLPSAAGPVDAGPTVLTLRGVFDELFDVAGTTLDAHLELVPQTILARHFWRDGACLDLHADPAATLAALEAFGGPRVVADFRHFDAVSAALYAAFDSPVMRAAAPDMRAAALAAMGQPRLWPWLLPGRSLAGALRGAFRDARLRQLFGRYTTYVGGIPGLSPAVLGLVWRAEAGGVWAVAGGMHRLAQALAEVFTGLGGTLMLAAPVARIVRQGGAVSGVVLADGTPLPCTRLVFNGDPAALVAGLLGPAAVTSVKPNGVEPRSLSARVWAFAARPEGPAMVHHNVFFADTEDDEFAPLARGLAPTAPTVYVCAQDRKAGAPAGDPERFQFILNAPALPEGAPDTQDPEEERTCRTQTFARLSQFGLHFDPQPQTTALTLPQGFARLFPASRGALYGRSPHGLLATLLRPQARTALPGLYLAGGGTHPGAGVPMAALSGRHAAEAILSDLTSASRSRRTAMPGGISTRSATTTVAPSR